MSKPYQTGQRFPEAAATFCEAIRTFAERPENLETLESYLTRHFAAWLDLFATDPESLAAEMKLFAEAD